MTERPRASGSTPPVRYTTGKNHKINKHRKINNKNVWRRGEFVGKGGGKKKNFENHFKFASGGWGYPPDPPWLRLKTGVRQWQTRYSQQHSGYTRLRLPRWPGRRHRDTRCLGAKAQSARPGTPCILKYVIRSRSFLIDQSCSNNHFPKISSSWFTTQNLTTHTHIIVLLHEPLQNYRWHWLDTNLHILNLGINNPNTTTHTCAHTHNVNTQRLIQIMPH